MDGQVRFIDMGGGEVRSALLEANDQMVYKIIFLPDNPHAFLTTQQDSTVRLHDLRARGTAQTLLDMRAANLGEYGINTLTFDPSGMQRFVLGCSDPYLRVYDVRKTNAHTAAFCPAELKARLGRGENRPFMPGFYITGVDWSTRGELAATYSRDHVYTFNASLSPDSDSTIGPVCTTYSQKFLGRRNVRTFLKEVAFLGGGQYVATGSDCGHLYIWSCATGELVQCIRADTHVVNGVAPHPHLLKIASCGIDSEGKVWDVGPAVTFDENKRRQAQERNGGAAGATAGDSDSEGGEVITLNQLLQLLRRSAARRGEAPQAGNLAQILRMLRGEGEGDDEDEGEEGEGEEEADEEAEGEPMEATGPSAADIAAELDEVEREKDRGNELFRNSDWHQARQSYTAALERLASVPHPPPDQRMQRNRYRGLRLTILMNRAAAAVKQDDATAAIQDCNLALELDPENVKAIYRRGCAYLLAGRFEEAEADANEALRLSPGNPELRRLLLAARGRRAGQL